MGEPDEIDKEFSTIPILKTLLETSGDEHKFDLSNKTGVVEFSKRVNLNVEGGKGISVCILEAPAFFEKRLIGRDLGFVLFQDDRPIGHVDFRILPSEPKTAQLYVSLLRSFKADGLPSYLSNLSDAFKDDYGDPDVNGFFLEHDFRRKGLGQVLWSLARAYLQTKGVDIINVKGDATGSGLESFYTKTGTLTRITQEQEILLAKALGIKPQS